MSHPRSAPAAGGNGAIADLVEALRAANAQLEALLAPGIHSVTAADGKAYLLQRAQAHAHARQQARERMLHAALSSITDYTYIVDPRGRLLFANQRMLDLWGITMEEALGKDAHDLGYLPEAARRFQQQIASVFATGRPVRDELAYKAAAGGEGFYAYEFSPVFAADGSVDFVVGCTSDITHLRANEQALHKSVAQFRTLAAAMPQIVCQWGLRGEAIYLNRQWVDYTGLPLRQGLGSGWLEVVHPDERARAEQACSSAVDGCDTYEARLRRADATYRWWLVRIVPLRDEGGTVLQWMGTCTDIDDMKKAELQVLRANRALRQQRAELRLVLDLVPAKIWLKDTGGRIIRINERAASDLGRSVAELEGAMGEDVFPGHPAAASHDTDLEVIRTGAPLLGVLERQVAEPGEEIWVQKDRVPFFDENGNVLGVLVLGVDVTERKRDQDALRQLNAELEDRVRRRTAELDLARSEAEKANRAKSDFLATMSHEIRTPMGGLLGLLELLAVSGLGSEQLASLQVARESGQTLLRLINDILDFSKIEANSLELHLVPTSIASVVANTCRLYEQVAASKNLRLDVDISPRISPYLSADPLRLGQVLNNFLNNAVKFTHSGGVRVQVELVGRHWDKEELLFTVTDTGIGMTPQQLERLFQPFVQAAADTSAHFGGTGLGLVISRRLAELMEGRVEVRSEPGVGTTITLLLMLEACDGGQPGGRPDADQVALRTLLEGRRAVPSRQEAEADGTLLLIVDDHPTNRLVLMRQVASLGYAAEAAEDGTNALEAWRHGRFGAVITDCAMPAMNGYELASAIRHAELKEGRPRIPIIACTANALPPARQACMGAGMDDCLVKPTQLAEVSAMLAQWVPIPADAVPAAPPPPTAAASPVAPASRGRTELLDLVLLAEISGGDQVAQAEMLLDFRSALESDAAALRQAVAAGDLAGVTEFAHRIKGSCLMLGAHLLADAGAQVEEASATGHPAALQATMGLFEREVARLSAYLEMFPSIRQKPVAHP